MISKLFAYLHCLSIAHPDTDHIVDRWSATEIVIFFFDR